MTVVDYKTLPKRYALSVEVKLTELPDQFCAMTCMGFDFRKSATITINHFSGIAKVIAQFDELTKQIEAERP
jgi:hypothetical protein